MFSQVCVKNSVHGGWGEGACVAGGHAWQGACLAGGACMAEGYARQGACMAGGHVCPRGCVWQGGGMHGRGACMAGGMCGRGRHAFVAGEMATAVDGTHLTRMHSHCKYKYCYFPKILTYSTAKSKCYDSHCAFSTSVIGSFSCYSHCTVAKFSLIFTSN